MDDKHFQELLESVKQGVPLLMARLSRQGLSGTRKLMCRNCALNLDYHKTSLPPLSESVSPHCGTGSREGASRKDRPESCYGSLPRIQRQYLICQRHESYGI